MGKSSIGRTAANLALAVLNATLILAAICLWFAWGAFSAANDVADTLSEATARITPVRSDIQSLTSEIAELRSALSEIQTSAQNEPARLTAVTDEISALRAEIASVGTKLETIAADPDNLIDRAVKATFDELGERIAVRIASLRATLGAAGAGQPAE